MLFLTKQKISSLLKRIIPKTVYFGTGFFVALCCIALSVSSAVDVTKISLSIADMDTNLWLIPQQYVKYTPDKFDAPNFGVEDLTISIKNDQRINTGSLCEFETRIYPNKGNINPAWTSENLSNGGKDTYQNSECKTTLPRSAQIYPKIEYRVRITNLNDKTEHPKLGAYDSYFWSYGALVVVDITAQDVP